MYFVSIQTICLTLNPSLIETYRHKKPPCHEENYNLVIFPRTNAYTETSKYNINFVMIHNIDTYFAYTEIYLETNLKLLTTSWQESFFILVTHF